MEKILVTGAAGQLGTELTQALVEKVGAQAVVASDINERAADRFTCAFEVLDVLDRDRMEEIIDAHGVTQVYHLAAILSAAGEKNPLFTWDLNMKSLLNVLELAREKQLNKIYWPSSIAVFGPGTPMVNTPQDCVMDPTTVYGISKLAGERWCAYYNKVYGVDVRSIRYPGLISYKAAPGGGTTDYAVEIYHAALKGETFPCFLEKGTYLPMMYMPDAIKATLDLMDAPEENIKVRSSYNVGALSFDPEGIYESIKKYIPEFEIEYHPDFRQDIANSWPDSIDDSAAREQWGWEPEYDLDTMTSHILDNLKVEK
ncbi:NAD-dependent epimerase/dehydratase family protein [Robertkochia sediminum]|uniref:NAD-dependent epimerase/dehydratase family protein n=1 Tax=Robertkochia sediminum TaxID=2785326 RepID=UPI00193201D0|nr:NAD-dependent epimerase/dehydratase family protein [Robertkochia sediminum]MBL7472518.1 NAD-dependent epimerase/dehydratase family protein [Robertkochia sediminum]